MNIFKKIFFLSLMLFVINGTAFAEVSEETAYIFNTFSFLVHGFLVMLMALGFTCLEAGLVRTKNTATICLKNVGLYSLAGIMFYLVGYGFMYNEVNGFMGQPTLWNPEVEVNSADGYSKMSDGQNLNYLEKFDIGNLYNLPFTLKRARKDKVNWGYDN